MSQGNADLAERARQLIRDIPDYPKPGIVFKDITPLLGNSAAFAAVTQAMAEPFAALGATHVVAIESRGFIFGGPIAQQLSAGLSRCGSREAPIAAATGGVRAEYGTDVLEIHADAVDQSSRVLIVDDVLATGEPPPRRAASSNRSARR